MTPQDAAELAAGYAAGKIIVAGAPFVMKAAADLIPPSFRDRIAKKACGVTTPGGHGLSPSVWGLPPLERGRLIEEALGRSPHLPFDFPVIDRMEDGIATSIKTMDLNAASYQIPSKLKSELAKQINAIAKFEGRAWKGVIVQPSEITGRALDIAIPRIPSAEQQLVVNQAIQEAARLGVTVRFFVFP